MFTDEELAREARPPSARALDALEAGDDATLHHELVEMAAGNRELVALALHWLARMFAKIRRDFGEAALDRVLAETTAVLMAPYAEQVTRGAEKQAIAELITLFVGLPGGGVTPSGETAEDVGFTVAPCGAGGRLDLEGWPQALPQHYAACDDGTPIYCRGCQALQRSFNVACGEAFWTTRPNGGLRGSCRMLFRKRPGAGLRLFDDHELYALTATRVERALERLFRGDRAIAELVRGQEHEWMPFHDLFVQWATYILSTVYREHGADYLDAFLAETYDSAFELLYPLYEQMDDVALVRMFARVWHYHMATFRIEEEDDRFVFVLDPCGSGGRLFRSEMHKGCFLYGNHRAVLMPEPHPINFNRRRFPIYCTHCASTNRAQFAGRPLMFVIDGEAQLEPGMPCRQYLYKKGAPRAVEPRLLAQVARA